MKQLRQEVELVAKHWQRKTLAERRIIAMTIRKELGLYKTISPAGIEEGAKMTFRLVSRANRYTDDEIILRAAVELVDPLFAIDKPALAELVGFKITKFNRVIREAKKKSVLTIAAKMWFFLESECDDEADAIGITFDEYILSLPLSSAGKVLYAFLRGYKVTTLNMSNEYIVSTLGWGKSKVIQYIDELENAGLIHRAFDYSERDTRRTITLKK